jgi:hypothetical protein
MRRRLFTLAAGVSVVLCAGQSSCTKRPPPDAVLRPPGVLPQPADTFTPDGPLATGPAPFPSHPGARRVTCRVEQEDPDHLGTWTYTLDGRGVGVGPRVTGRCQQNSAGSRPAR